MKALATGHVLKSAFSLVTDCQPLSGSDPELLDLFVCLFLFLLRGFFFFKIAENACDGNGPSFLDEKSHSSFPFLHT